MDSFGKLDILVNNAARIMSKLVVDMTRDDWESIMSVNVTGAFLHSREAMKVMIPNKSGAIVNIASYAAYFAFPQIAAYTSSKGALVQLTRTLALEAIEHGIRVNAIGVGDVVTNIWRVKWMMDRPSLLITVRRLQSAAPRTRTRSLNSSRSSRLIARASSWAR